MEPAGPARVERRLAAVLAADVAGYSRLIEAAEEATLARLKMLRAEIIDPRIAGHKGRIGIFELMVINDELRDLITNNASIDDLRLAARRMGMSTLRECGLRAIFNGITTIEEVVRETITEDE